METPPNVGLSRGLVGCLLVAFAGMAMLLIVNQSVIAKPSPIAAPSAMAAGQRSESLRDKSDQELLQLVIGRTSSADEDLSKENEENRVKFSSLDRLWEMPPQEAAVAFASDYVSKEAKGLSFKIDDPNAHPPKSGEIGIRWISGNSYAAPEQGVTILRYDGYNSMVLVSQVEIVGRPSKEEIESAVMKTDSHLLPMLVAQQTYEIIWWLRHVHPVVEPGSGRSATYSSVDDFGRFWMKPDGPVIEQAIFGEPCGECAAGNPAESYESFAETLIRRLIERSGIRPRYPVPKVGTYVDSDADSKFLRTEPRPKSDDPKVVRVWVDQMIEILHNPNRQYLHSEVINRLVPISDPLRYKDSRIDAALTDILHRDLEATAKFKLSPEPPELDPSKFQDIATLEKDAKKYEEKENKRREEERRIDNLRLTASSAAEKLGFHDAVNAFPELLRLAASPELFSPASSAKVPLSWPFNQALIAASAIAGKHPELRPALIEFLKSQFAGFSDKSEMPAYLLEAAWRADLRDLAPSLQEITNAKPAPGKDTAEQSGNRLHEAQVILTAWKETDPFTKTKLDIMLTGDIGGGNSIPEVLRKEFEDLSKEDQLTIRNFVNWLRTVDVPWSRRYIEHIFTPHTPRPDIPIER